MRPSARTTSISPELRTSSLNKTERSPCVTSRLQFQLQILNCGRPPSSSQAPRGVHPPGRRVPGLPAHVPRTLGSGRAGEAALQPTSPGGALRPQAMGPVFTPSWVSTTLGTNPVISNYYRLSGGRGSTSFLKEKCHVTQDPHLTLR